MRKMSLILLQLFRPLFLFWAKKRPAYFEKLRQFFQEDPYGSGMIAHFSSLHEVIYKPFFEKVKGNAEDFDRLGKLSKKGVVVYVMKNRGQLEYSFFNYRF